MKNLSKLLIAEQLKNKKERLSMIKKVSNLNTNELDWSLKSLLPKANKNQEFESILILKTFLIKRLELQINDKINKELARLNFSKELKPVLELTITVEWKKSTMWGLNPTAETYINGLGHLTSGAIGGCGYDKQSTAVATILNQIPHFLQLMYEMKNKNYKTRNHELLGYGSGYGILPEFEEGVGVGCYEKIFNKIGYKFTMVASTKNFNVFSISKLRK